MQINKEPRDKHAIQSYSLEQIIINNETYEDNLLITHDTIITDWTNKKISDLYIGDIQSLLNIKPEILIIGHEDKNLLPNFELMQALSKNNIGFEFMTIGAACRTFNVLLSEERRAVLGLLLPSPV